MGAGNVQGVWLHTEHRRRSRTLQTTLKGHHTDAILKPWEWLRTIQGYNLAYYEKQKSLMLSINHLKFTTKCKLFRTYHSKLSRMHLLTYTGSQSCCSRRIPSYMHRPKGKYNKIQQVKSVSNQNNMTSNLLNTVSFLFSDCSF